MWGSMVDIRSPATENRRGKKKKERNHSGGRKRRHSIQQSVMYNTLIHQVCRSPCQKWSCLSSWSRKSTKMLLLSEQNNCWLLSHIADDSSVVQHRSAPAHRARGSETLKSQLDFSWATALMKVQWSTGGSSSSINRGLRPQRRLNAKRRQPTEQHSINEK